MSKLLENIEEISGQPIENACLDPNFYRDDLARLGNRIVKVTDLPYSVDDNREVVLDDVIYIGRTFKFT